MPNRTPNTDHVKGLGTPLIHRTYIIRLLPL